MVARRVRRKSVSIDLDDEVSDYLLNRSTRERAEFHEGRAKAHFLEILAESGELQEGGHRILRLNEPQIFYTYKGGKPTEKTIIGIQRQERKGTSVLNEDRTLAFLQKRGLLERCTEMVRVINEDAILAANFDETITDKDLKSLYDQSPPTYAFYLVEGEGDTDD